ncbi:Phage Tail Collar Domain [Pseudorhodobacter antarcticus]|uniref:Phage Tail Collar Domain n=1 Tax=Pseudorhodobacter antarcticus TaxID=1077947 RepID=A0A1H8IGX2_9RHOB|nr:phage tail protein [Pseudorhodobacter antarcticus]SEN67764.1 Phage Tail Collar Domain [Pseudorhodobacter antarcticus]
MGLSRLEYPYTGGPRTFAVNFALGYLNKEDVQVYVQGELDALGDQIFRAFTWNGDAEVQVTDAIAVDTVVVVVRTVARDQLVLDVSGTASFTRATLVRGFKQVMMTVHEFLDGRVAAFDGISTIQDFLITVQTQVARSVVQADLAVAKAAEALASQLASAVSAAAALVSQTSATASASTATTKAGEASTSASSASSSAGTATSKAAEATGAAGVAGTQAGIASTKAGEALASQTAAGVSAVVAVDKAAAALISQNAAAASAVTASTGANTATTKASEALVSRNEAEAFAAVVDPASYATAAQGALAAAVSEMMVGQIAFYAMNTAPPGTLKANGAAVSRATYARLFARIGIVHGAGNGSTTFNLPDRRGEFIRGWDDGRGVDPGRVFGSAQAGGLQAHTHTYVNAINGSYNGANADVSGGSNGSNTNRVTGSTGGGETRPRNVADLAVIFF